MLDSIFFTYSLVRQKSLQLSSVILKRCFNLSNANLVSCCVVAALVGVDVVPDKTEVVIKVQVSKIGNDVVSQVSMFGRGDL